MAYTGDGTKANPYIVNNWTDFMSAAQVAVVIPASEGHLAGYRANYIKWADQENKELAEVNVTSTEIRVHIADIDFNGWTIDQFNIDVGFSATMGRQIFLNDIWGLETPNVVPGYTVRNLTVNHYYTKDPSVMAFRGFSLYHCYILDITSFEFASNHQYWVDYGGAINNGSLMAVWYSRLNYNGKDTGRHAPNIGSVCYSEIKVNYKYTLDNASEYSHGLFPRDMLFDHAYYYGKFDLSEGSGSWCVSPPLMLQTQYALQTESSIFNIQTIVGENCTMREMPSGAGGLFGDWTWFFIDNTKNYFVTNNGDNYAGYNGSVNANIKGLLGDVKNPDQLTIDGFTYIPDDLHRNPKYRSDNMAEDWGWRWAANVNTGIPFLPFFDKGAIIPPEYSGAVEENPYITVYDMETPQNGFENHGLAVLRPTSCRVVEELNGAMNLTLTHPKDAEGKWQYILEMNIIKCLGQLYVIQKVDEVNNGGSGYVQAYAEHITYTLNDKWIFPPVEITGYQGQTLIDNIMALATDMGGDWQTQYTFTITTDINADETFKDWYYMPDGVTPYEMILGDSGFVAKLGGELYRDNFTVKINERMYGAQSNAFELAVGYNLTGIKRTVDLQTFCTYLRGYDISDEESGYDNWFAVSWDPSTLPRAYPRNVVRSMNFSYEHPEYAEGQLGRDTMAFFNQNCAPLVSYEINVQDLKRNPDYKEFDNNYRYKVGDKGWVWDERLKSWLELEITRTEKDGITGDCTKVVIGTQRSFTRPNGYVPVIPRSYVVIPETVKTVEGTLPITVIATGESLLSWTIYGVEGGLGEHGSNYLPQPTHAIANGATGTTEGTITFAYFPAYKTMQYYPPDIPDGETVGVATEMQWLNVTYSKSRTYRYNNAYISCRVDDRTEEYASSNFTTTLPAGSYKLIIEGWDNRGTSTRWRSDRLSRYAEGGGDGFGQPVFKLFDSEDTVLASFTLVQETYTNSKFFHEEVAFTLSEETDVGLFFYGMGEYSHPRCQIVESTTVAQSFSFGDYSGVSCWEPYQLYIPVTITGGGSSQTVNIPISEPLEEGDSISSDFSTVQIPTYNGETTFNIDNTPKPRMRITYKEGGVIGGD